MNSAIYSVRDWDIHFENNRSRTVENLRWVCVPNRHDGEGYSLIMEQKNAAELFAAWVLILQVSSKCQVRGTLMREDGTGLTAKSLSIKTRAPEKWFVEALKFFTINVPWLDCQESDSQPAPDCQPDDTHLAKKEGNRIEEKGSERRAAFVVPDDFPEASKKSLAEWKNHRREIKKAITPTQWEKILKQFKANPGQMIAAVEKSITNGWQGLFPDDSIQPESAKPKATNLPDRWRIVASMELGRDCTEIEYDQLTYDEKHAVRKALRV